MTVLNPTLFKALEKVFGEPRVAARGVAIKWHIVKRANLQQGDMYESRKVEVPGEEYLVSCPYCNDTRHRLSINHRWGVPDPELATRNLWLMRCYNEECQNDPDNQHRLFETVYPLCGPDVLQRMKINPGKPAATRPTEMAPPGPMLRLDKLAARHPNHHALQYLKSRYLDPVKLAKYYQVSYCFESQLRFAADRIIFPVRMDGMLVGWQARYIGDKVLGRSFKEAGVPKFYSCPGQARRVIGFNYDGAVRHPTLVIVEGPTDVSNFGVQALGIMGKTMGPQFQKRIASLMKRRWGDEGVIVVMLDPEQDAVSKAKGRPHHITTLAASLRAFFPRVVPVFLPEGYDPGNYDYRLARECIREAANKEGLQVSFRKPPKIVEEKARRRKGQFSLQKYEPRE